MPTFSRALLKFAGPICAALLLLAGSLCAPAQTTQQAIEARLKSQPLYLRGQWAPNNLQFDLAGATSSPSISAPFTLCGIDVNRVQLNDNQLEITGDRVGLEFEKDTPRRISLHTPLKIKIAGSSGADYTSALDKIFAADLPALVPSMPFYWQGYAQAYLLPQTQGIADPPGHTRKNPSFPTDPMHFPKVLSSVAPAMPDASRTVPYKGTSLIGIVVEKDGTIHQPHIVRPAGLGLDEEALRAVAQYRFKPATDNNDNPISCEIDIEVNFEIR